MSKKRRSQKHSNERVYAMLWHMYVERLDGINRGLSTYQDYHHVGHWAVDVEDLIDHEPTRQDAEIYLRRGIEKRDEYRHREEELKGMAQELLKKASAYGYFIEISGIMV